jgi:type II secretory pathway component HofQ
MFVGITAVPLSQLASPGLLPATPQVLPDTFFNGNPTSSLKDTVDPFANIDKNLHPWIETQKAPSNLRSRDGAVSVILGVTLDVDWDYLER